MIKLIALVDSRWGVSRDEKIPWSFQEDRVFFREKTINSIVVMGRNTFSSIHYRPLENRVNLIVSKTMKSTPGAKVFRSLEEIVDKYADFWLIGGASLYKHALKNDLVHYALITRVNKDHGADKFIDAANLEHFSQKIIFNAKQYSILEMIKSDVIDRVQQ
ncbi:MAG: dihydrofolate reductase [Holosporaceae bacterium]|jgi:dihydrofolate reductase|nr:dihydrofolate reductase [Holosporaceae bacterium]